MIERKDQKRKDQNRKYRLAWFTVAQWEKEQDWLRRQHQQGWKLLRTNGFCFYTFEKCEPEDVVYQLDYNKKHKGDIDEYIKMFEDCGWEHIIEQSGYSYFRKPVSGMKQPEEIFCDNASRLDMIQRIFRGRVIPVFFVFLACVLWPLISHVMARDWKVVIIYSVLTAVYVILFASILSDYRRIMKKYGREK